MKVIVIGAGASGLVAALEAAKKGCKVTVLELKNEAGKKIYATGNGRCNITNKKMGIEYYNCDDYDFLNDVLNEFNYENIKNYFNELGLKFKNIGDYIYPYSKRASSVVNVLINACLENKVEFICNCNVKNIEKNEEGFIVTGNVLNGKEYSKKYYKCDKVIVSTGGKAAKYLGSDGSGYYLLSKLSHKINDVVPALVPLVCSENNKKTYMKSLAGVRSDVFIRVVSDSLENIAATSEGEIQLTDYGVSGIVVFQISGKVNEMLRNNEKVYLLIDFMPDIDRTKLSADIIEYVNKFNVNENEKKKMIVNRFIENNLNEKLANVILTDVNKIVNNRCGRKENDIEEYIHIATDRIKNFKIQIVGSKGFDNAQVCRGGISLKQINRNFESKIVKDLYIVGEVLDVDGICGGYNLHFAFASGIIAGRRI